MKIEGEFREMGIGDAVAILPGKSPKVWNIGDEVLFFLCCCAPAYTHKDTVLTE